MPSVSSAAAHFQQIQNSRTAPALVLPPVNNFTSGLTSTVCYRGRGRRKT